MDQSTHISLHGDDPAVHGADDGLPEDLVVAVPGARYVQALLSLVELLHYCALIGRELHSDATPAFLCHKELAQGTQSPQLGAFLVFRWFFWYKDR